MTNLARNAVAVVAVVNVLWGGGLFVAYMVRDVTPPAQTLTATAGPAVASDAVVTIAGPPVAGTVAATGLPTMEQKRAHLEAGPTGSAAADAVVVRSTGTARGPHGRWEDRTGVALSPPVVAGVPMDPTAVTVHVKDEPIQRALAEVGTAVGATLVIYPSYVLRQSPFPRVTLDADGLPLLEVVNQLCAKTGLAAGPRSTSNWSQAPASADPAAPVIGLQVQEANYGLGPWVTTGPFAFEVQRISHVSPISDEPGAQGSLTVTLALQHEPKVVVLGQQANAAATALVDDDHHTLGAAPPPPVARRPSGNLLARMFGLGGGGPAPAAPGEPWNPFTGTLMLTLNGPPDLGRRITRLHVAPRFVIQTASERVEEPVKRDGPTIDRVVGGVHVLVGPLQVQGSQQCTCEVTFDRGAKSTSNADPLGAALQGLCPVLTDDRGRALPVPQRMSQGEVGSTVHAQFYWVQQQYGDGAQLLRPTKLVLDVPTAVQVVEVPVDLVDLPLP
jgi:hypothetical protein